MKSDIENITDMGIKIKALEFADSLYRDSDGNHGVTPQNQNQFFEFVTKVENYIKNGKEVKNG